jgi:addiction module HigA family antidote
MGKSQSEGMGGSLPPAHPGILLRRQHLIPSGMTERAFAEYLDLSLRTVSEVVCEKRPVTRTTAEKIVARFGGDPEFWIEQQHRYDAWQRRRDRENGANGDGGGPPRAPS